MLLILSVLGGCKNKIPKTPENFDQDLWRDSVEIMDVLYTTIEKEDNFSVEDENKIKEYFATYHNRVYSNIDEYVLINRIYKVYENYNEFVVMKSFNCKTPILKKMVQEDKEKFENSLLELKQAYEEIKS